MHDDAPQLGPDEADDEIKVAWRVVEGQPILTQLGHIAHLIGQAEEEDKFATSIMDAGVPADMAAITLTFAGREKTALSLGLQLIGYFSEQLAPVAEELIQRGNTLNTEILESFTEEQRALITDAEKKVAAKELAEMLGIPIEEAVEAIDGMYGNGDVEATVTEGAFGERLQPTEWARDEDEQ